MANEANKIDFRLVKKAAEDSIKNEQRRYNPHFAESDLQEFAPFIASGIVAAIKECERQKA